MTLRIPFGLDRLPRTLRADDPRLPGVTVGEDRLRLNSEALPAEAMAAAAGDHAARVVAMRQYLHGLCGDYAPQRLRFVDGYFDCRGGAFGGASRRIGARSAPLRWAVCAGGLAVVGAASAASGVGAGGWRGGVGGFRVLGRGAGNRGRCREVRRGGWAACRAGYARCAGGRSAGVAGVIAAVFSLLLARRDAAPQSVPAGDSARGGGRCRQRVIARCCQHVIARCCQRVIARRVAPKQSPACRSAGGSSCGRLLRRCAPRNDTDRPYTVSSSTYSPPAKRSTV